MSKIALIDADSLIYMIGWNFKDKEDDDPILDSFEHKKPRVIEQVDQNVISILTSVGADHYLGALGHPTVQCFRQDVAKFKEYKANRKAELEVFKIWKPVIKERLFTHWGFISVAGLEADDIISLAAEDMREENMQDGREPGHGYVVCSIDKDLRQIPGAFYDYKKLDFGDVNEMQATWLFWYQMIVGDSGDGVAGIPKKGDVAAHKALDPLVDSKDYAGEMERTVRRMYFEHFGDHYGEVLLKENAAVLGMMNRKHLFYDEAYLQQVRDGLKKVADVVGN